MTSSMMVGEKKWATARKKGMTVLGKVPKPLNLPSQKSENHGLDPNVEIVPKGTVSWGSQSSSVPNAWGSSSVSPKADGSSGSPSYLNGRPSSGSGTRPSTAGSDRTQDPNPSVWGQTSRPSSASGALTSNQTGLASLRPRSAETRPGSSQLSRFAEQPPSDNSFAWGPNGAPNKMGGRPSNKDGFSLSSGDFPTLGSEKDGSGKNIDSQECGYHSRPGSSSSRAAEKNVPSSVGNVRGESANTWTRDASQHADFGVQPTLERWQGDMPPGGNPHRPPQNYDAWRGPPMTHPRAWYPGPPVGPPYGPPLHPSGYPMEPYPFYRPQMPPNNSQQVPPGPTLRGHHPKNGEFRPHVPDGYMHPRMPMNSGFYGPPPVPYEGFYGPPMGYCNPNERDMPFMGMPPGPPVYKRHPYDNNAIDPHSRSPVHGSRGKSSAPERMEPRSGHSEDTRGQYKVLLKHSKDWDEKRAEGEWGLEDDHGNYPLDSAKLPESRGKMNAVDNLGSKPRNESSFSQPSVSPKSPTLMQKIDGLNSKSRNFDGRPDVATLPSREDGYNQLHTNRIAPSRRPSHGVQGRVDHRGKRLNYQDDDGWRKDPLAGESSAEISVSNVGGNSNVLVCDRHNILEEPGRSEFNLQGKDDKDHPMLFFDESDNLAQRAKMLEIAKQRAEKRQKEEEERTREQKAKALAKLEELNRRSNIVDAPSQKSEKAPPSGIGQQEGEKSRKSVESNTDSSKSETSGVAVVRNRKDHIRASNSIMVGENAIVFDGPLLEKPDIIHFKSEVAIGEVASQVSDGSVVKHRQTEYKQRQGVNSTKSVTVKSILLTQTNEPSIKATSNNAAHPENIASSGEPCLVTGSNVMTDSSTHNKRKNNRSSKNKHKVDEVAPVSVVPSTVAKEIDAAKVSTEKPEQDTNLRQSKTVVTKPTIEDLELRSSLIEESSRKGSHQWKPQQSRRMPRNQHGNNRTAEREKSHSSETGTWAPVRSHDKIEQVNKPGDKAESGNDATNAKVESVVQNNTKTKRAEIERYVPKPVAKELAQQVSIQQPVVAQNIENTQHGDSGIADVDIKQSKPSRARGPWKQRVYVESVPNQGLLEAEKNDVQKPVEQNQSLKSDKILPKEQITDGWNINENFDTSASNANIVSKGRGMAGRGNRQQFKGNRSMGNNFELDHGNAGSGSTYDASSESGMNQMDKNAALKENRFVGERTPKWQPKSQVYPVHNLRNRPNEEQMDVPANKTQIDQSHSKSVTVEAAQNVVHQDLKRERKPSSSRGRPVPPANSDNAYVNNDQQFSSGFRKNGNNNNNNRSGRGYEPRGDGPFNRERPRQTSHFEYQPVGQYGNNKPNNLDGGSTEGSHNMGPKYRERNQGYPRRGGGNFYGRQGGDGHGDARFE